ncbi:MAG: pirin family protein [Gammaproteobacteria bacterium]|nr:MAG: pirin family protein [Gammaproteobacteria bacterium]
MAKIRKIKRLFKGQPTMDGAGVDLKRIFGFNEANELDPFLLMDHFGSDNPDHYINGFPWHPHRGIETITYMLEGDVEHKDSLGNTGNLSAGDVQWMTAGSGIIHQEMPKAGPEGRMYGFQLWANLPASHKMMPPRYQDIKSDQIPEVILEDGVSLRVLCGKVGGIEGPVRDIIIDPEYIDVRVPAGTSFVHPTKPGHTVFIYLFEGEGESGLEDAPTAISANTLVHYEDGEQIRISAKDSALRFIVVAGKPIGEPVAWHGPIVMNKKEELKTAVEEFRNGTFIKQT